MKKIFTVSLAGLCVISLLTVGLYTVNKNKPNDKNLPDYQAANTSKMVPSMAMKSLTMTNEEKEAIFQKWFASAKIRCSSIEEARKIVPYPIKFPDQKLTGEIEGIYVDKSDNPQEKDVFVRFRGGYNNVTLSICYRPDKPDLGAHVKQMIEEKEKGYSHGDKVPQILKVNGVSAWTIEPGYNVIDNQKFPRPGVVQWWDNGIFYSLVGTSGENGTSLEKLMEIAGTIIDDPSSKPESYKPIQAQPQNIIDSSPVQPGEEQISAGPELEK